MADGLRSTGAVGAAGPECSLVLPCYNEADSLRGTVTGLARCFRDLGSEWELVLVDNGSTDATGKVIDELISEGLPVVKHRIEVNQGYGNGILQGLRLARGRLVGFSCADAQIEAKDVVRLFEIAQNTRTPKLFKVRRRFRTETLPRRVVSVVYNLVAHLLFGSLGTSDLNANPKILPRSCLERMNLQAKDWFLDPEVMIKAKRMGLGVVEMNIIAQMRAEGSSNVRASTCWEFIVNLLRYRFGSKRATLAVRPLE